MSRGSNKNQLFKADRAMLATVPGLVPHPIPGYAATSHVRVTENSRLTVMKLEGGKLWAVRYAISPDGAKGTTVGHLHCTREEFAATVAQLEALGEAQRSREAELLEMVAEGQRLGIGYV